MKLVKKNANYYSEESVVILSGTTSIYTSPAFTSGTNTFEACLTATTNNQYTMQLKDSYGDSWSSGAWVEIRGLYDNIFFKGTIVAASMEEYSLSMYYPVEKATTWKSYSGADQAGWNTLNFSDSAWTDVVVGSSVAVSGTQFYRKTFTGLTTMAAYELALQYTAGVIAYINGVEIYRDNMPEGPVTSGTAASGAYIATIFHNVIRPGFELASSAVLAVELHFTPVITSEIFNAWMALLAPSTLEKPCAVYPYDVTMTGAGTNLANAFDWAKQSLYTTPTDGESATLGFQLSTAKAFFNGLRVWPYTAATTGPRTLAFQGSHSIVSGTWENIMDVTNAVFTNNQYYYLTAAFSATMFNAYQAVITIPGSAVKVYELQPLVCNIPPPTAIEYEQTSYSAYANYGTINAIPIVREWTGCTSNPPLPAGLTLGSDCLITGVGTVNAPTTTYTLTAQVNGQQYTGTVSINVELCSGTLAKIRRTYSSGASAETFSIKDLSTNQVVMNVEANSGQVDNQTWEVYFCMNSPKYEVSIGGTGYFWAMASFMYIRAVISDDVTDTIFMAKYQQHLALPTSYIITPQYQIKAHTQWYYKFNEVPQNWHNSDTTGYAQGIADQFPAATNNYQIYKRSFTVDNIAEAGSISLLIRYRYGIIVYMNGHEVFRNYMPAGDLTSTMTATGSYSDLKFRQIILPAKTIATATQPSVSYIQQGTNHIAIALVSITATQTAAEFDAALRMTGPTSFSRLSDGMLYNSGISGSPANIPWFHHTYYIYSDACTNNYLEIQFHNDRRECITSVSVQLEYRQFGKFPRNFVVKAKNSDTTYDTLAEVEGLTWSLVGQNRKIWLANNKAYNTYRLENISTGDPNDCSWQLGTFALNIDNLGADAGTLSYEPNISIYKGIEMAEVYPNSSHFTDFSINPVLPAGITIDPYNGMISGTASTVVSAQTYTVTARKYNSIETVTATFTLDVDICTGGRSLITMVSRTDSSYESSSYKLYQGKQATGTPIQQIDKFKAANIYNYADFCLDHGLYTAQLLGPASGWTNPAGYYFSVDIGAFRYDVGQVSAATHDILFSSLLPFQMEYDNWKLFKGTEPVDANWKNADFDDSTWMEVKAAEFGTSEAVTVYARRIVNIPDINDYQVLNVIMKYTGGIVAYFNGRKVARFNLEENYNDQSSSLEVHDPTQLSKFHIILPVVGGVTGNNVIAFEIHRAYGQSSAVSVTFDATGVFGVQECSVLADTYRAINGTAFDDEHSIFFDMTTVTFGSLPNEQGTFLFWEVENLEGSKFNSLAMQTVTAATSLGFSLYGRMSESPEEISIFAETGLSTTARARSAWSVPVGMASFHEYRWEIDVAASTTISFNNMLMQYCKASGQVCESIDDFPAVASGQISPSTCPEGYRGYSYRECTGTTFSEIKTDKCEYKLPDKLVYPQPGYTFVMGTQISSDAPTYQNIIEEFYLAENVQLPPGLTLNAKTGKIEGVPTAETSIEVFTIFGRNPKGATSTTLAIQVRLGQCAADGDFPLTSVGRSYTYECAIRGNYMGTITRECKLGAVDGEWQEGSGMCVSTTLIIVLVVVVIVIIVVAMVAVMKKNRKDKAKPKKSVKKTSKNLPKTESKKEKTVTV